MKLFTTALMQNGSIHSTVHTNKTAMEILRGNPLIVSLCFYPEGESADSALVLDRNQIDWDEYKTA